LGKFVGFVRIILQLLVFCTLMACVAAQRCQFIVFVTFTHRKRSLAPIVKAGSIMARLPRPGAGDNCVWNRANFVADWTALCSDSSGSSDPTTREIRRNYVETIIWRARLTTSRAGELLECHHLNQILHYLVSSFCTIFHTSMGQVAHQLHVI
jgi:hypothetical protein